MPVDLDNSSTMNDSTTSGDASVSSPGNQMAPPKPEKKKRNLPGMPDPDSEVIALSPKTLMATNRFVCEICNKGFQRDQNLQLHRRGHNLPWKLRQRSGKEIRKRVYVCPEESCVHHDPLRALGDITGIKKHFCRKHGEKKWKCDKCSKNYAVQSDWKAHSKICGNREYKCDCGTLFSRDSFITHRPFCDALAVGSAKEQPLVAPPSVEEKLDPQTVASSPPAAPPSPPASTAVISSVLPSKAPELQENSIPNSTQILDDTHTPSQVVGLSGSCSSSSCSSSNGSASSTVFASLFALSTASGSLQSQTTGFADLIRAVTQPIHVLDLAPSSSTEPISLCLATNHGLSIFGTAGKDRLAPSSSTEPISLCLATNRGSSIFETAGQEHRQYAPLPQPAMSATALLQKAAQMGSASTNASLLTGFGIVSSTGQQQWNGQEVEPESASLAAGLGLGLPCDGSSGLKELMMETASMFGPKHTTLDLLGLGMAAGGGLTSGLSALMTSIGGGLDAAATSFGGAEFSGEEMGRSS